MKKIAVLLVTFISAQAFSAVTPRDGYYVCGRISDNSVKSQCISVVANSQYIDQYAAGACDRIQNANHTLTCMQTIADRSFDLPAVEACDSVTTATETIQCLANVGRPIGHNPRPPSENELRRWVRDAARYTIEQLNRGNHGEVRRTLEEMTRL